MLFGLSLLLSAVLGSANAVLKRVTFLACFIFRFLRRPHLATRDGKPLLLCDLHAPTEELLAVWQDWLLSHSIAILNIAGPSEARNPGIYLQASALLELFWSKEHEPI